MLYGVRNTPRYSMDYLADLPNLICSILEPTTTKNGGTASCRSAVFFGSEEEDGRGRRWLEMTWRRTRRGRERKKEDFGEDWNGSLRRTKTGLGTDKNKGFQRNETRTLRRTKQGLWGEGKRESGIMWFYRGFSVKCDFDSQHSQHSQHFPLKALRMSNLIGG